MAEEIEMKWACISDEGGVKSYEWAKDGSVTVSDGESVTYHDIPQPEKMEELSLRHVCPKKKALMNIDVASISEVDALKIVIEYLQANC